LDKVESIISELLQQREAIDRAIGALRDIGGVAAPAKKRGRPPGKKTRGGKRNMSEEGRARIADAARRRWAEMREARGEKEPAKEAAKKGAKKVAKKKDVESAAAE
jgi:hypothetical protein